MAQDTPLSPEMLNALKQVKNEGVNTSGIKAEQGELRLQSLPNPKAEEATRRKTLESISTMR